MGVQQFHRSHSPFTDNRFNRPERQLQFFGLRKNRLKQSALQRSRPCRLRRQMNFHNGRARRIRLQIKLQQFKKHFRIQHGRRQTQSSNKGSSKGPSENSSKGASDFTRNGGGGRFAIVPLHRCQFQFQPQLLRRQRTSAQSRAHLL